ncbi:right-handed parallel beta-helix repeat-containing protein [Pontivivens insulae]|uniref:Right handed beta helix domain-containing protein n=1 Tax=Pontivivens insulae TaxID=1639689 RepID=A0A2R8A7B5_9RHOB|nr:right-handed parallel beta-helix repeat-containing protein [Pontivivens insulae]RED18235.1 hypothetical protein DFR53_0430 [Pontivivens insulae]SPF28133.1 hypothetical protein POI8812_00431 [Pontivivens insulae]
MLRLLILLFGFMAQTTFAQSIASDLARGEGDLTLSVQVDEVLSTQVIEGRTVTLRGDGGRLLAADDLAAFFVRDGGHLILQGVDLTFAGTGDAQPLIFVADEGTVTLRDCSLDALEAVGLFVSGGHLEVSNCQIATEQTAIAVRAAGTATLTDLTIAGGSSAIRLQDAGTDVVVADLAVRNVDRGVTVESGAHLQAERLSVTEASEVAILVPGGVLRATDLAISQDSGFGVYVSDGGQIDVDDLYLEGQMGQAVSFLGAAASTVRGLVARDAQLGVLIDNASALVTLIEPNLSTELDEGTLVRVANGDLSLRGGILLGGSTGLSVLTGDAEVRETAFVGQSRSSVFVRGTGSGAVTLDAVEMVMPESAYAVYAERPVELRNALILHAGVPVGGEGYSSSVIEQNMRMGPAVPGWGDVHRQLNRSITPDATGPDLRLDILNAPDEVSRAALLANLDAVMGEVGGAPGQLDLLTSQVAAREQPVSGMPLGTLFREEGGAAEQIAALTPADLPLRLAPGRYVLESPAGAFRLEMPADGTVLLPELYGAGPYPSYEQYEVDENGNWYLTGTERGPAFSLRSQGEIRALAQSFWPGYQQYVRSVVPRPEASEAERAAARTSALAHLSAQLDRLPGDETSLPADLLADMNLESEAALAILATVGTADEIAWLIARGEELSRRQLWIANGWLRAGLSGDLRLGLRPEGPARAAFGRAIEAPPAQKSQQALVVTTLAQFGFQPAIEWLIQRMAKEQSLSHWQAWQRNAALRALIPVDDPAVTAYAHRLLSAWREQDNPTGPWRDPDDLVGGLAAAFLIVAANGNPVQRQVLDVALPEFDRALLMASALADPLDYMQMQYRMWSGGPDEVFIRQVARQLCHAAGPRIDLTDGDGRIAGLLQAMVANFEDTSPFWGATVHEIALAHCRAHPRALSRLNGRLNELMREAGPDHWQHAFADYGAPSAVGFAALDNAPDSWRAPVLDAFRDTPEHAQDLHRAIVATTRHDAAAGFFFPDGDRRFFLEPVEEEPVGEAYWLSGRVDLRMIERGQDLYAAIRLNVTGVTHQGLGGMIASHPDILAVALANGGIGLIRSVSLTVGEDRVEMPMGQSAGGITIFGPIEAPAPLDDLHLDIEMRADGRNARDILRSWTVRFPLYNGPDAWRRLYETGTVGFGSETQ